MSNIKKANIAGVGPKKRRIWILWIVSLVLAFTFWLYATSLDNITVEETFNLIDIEYDNTQIKQHGLVVQSISIDTVNVTIMGSQREVRSVSKSDIKAQISLESITQPGEYSLNVNITTPDKTTLTAQTVEKVTVTVDKSSEKIFMISPDSIELFGWNLGSGCHFDKSTVNATKATVSGPTLELDSVDSIKVRTSSIGNATNGQTVAAEVILIDKFGDEIKSKNLSVKVNTDILTVKLSIYMEKTVKLTASGKHGYFDDSNVSVSPSSVTLIGSPEAIEKISYISVADIDETKELTDRSFTVSDISLPDGVRMVAVDGSEVTEAEVSIFVSEIKHTYVKIPAKNVELLSTSGLSAQTDINVLVRFSSAADPSLIGSKLPVSCIIASADATSAKEGDEIPVILLVAENFRDSIYILDMPYTVVVGASQISDNTPSIGGEVTPL